MSVEKNLLILNHLMGINHIVKHINYKKYGNLDKLQDMQYILFRIKWNEINSQSGKDLMKKKIDNFLEFYNGI